jgi:hypothetical protein
VAAQKQCIDCHQDEAIHSTTLGDECGSCHTQSTWQGATFNHNQASFSLEGRHQTVDCLACHTNGQWSGISQTCVGCHQAQDLHAGRLGWECDGCHVTASWHLVIDEGFDHSRTRFTLYGSHLETGCDACHISDQVIGIPRSCNGCHAQPLTHIPSLDDSCSLCHLATKWRDVRFDHRQTGFSLTGTHRSQTCAKCHAEKGFHATSSSCVSCHPSSDRHNGALGRECQTCHTSTRWDDLTFDHGTTGFPLTGAHNAISCGTCHAEGAYAGTPTACMVCHAEPAFHQGSFTEPCSTCHTAETWRPASYPRDHLFPLDHEGENPDCGVCHPLSVSTYTCYGCHPEEEMLDVHASDATPQLDRCAGCHP